MSNSFFRNLLPTNFNTEGDKSVLKEINFEIENQSVLFYPSSGIDFNDLFYVNSKRIEEINEFSPNIFIHTDYMCYRDFGLTIFDRLIDYPNFNILSKLKYYNDEKSINLYKLKRPNSQEIKWLVFFRGYYNEEIIKELVVNKIKTPVVYAICDGITNGMGNCYEKSIPTILYPFLASDLGINFIITEQSWDFVRGRFEDEVFLEGEDIFRLWLKNIFVITNDDFIKQLLDLSNEDLRKSIRQRLSAIIERRLNEEGKLRCYDDRFAEVITLKKINP